MTSTRAALEIKPRRLEDDFGAGGNAERLDDEINSSQRALHRGHFERVPDPRILADKPYSQRRTRVW